MYYGVKLVPNATRIDFVDKRFLALTASVIAIVISILSILFFGLNLGIDFSGGILVEVQTTNGQPADLGVLRAKLSTLGISTELQGVIGINDLVIVRLQQPKDVAEVVQGVVLSKVREALGSDKVLHRVELVGPKVGHELIESGIWATVLAILAIVAYVWFRFEWQFGLGGMLALLHDVITTIGLLSLTQMEFNLQSVAALLTISGYSINDSVVVYDRIRENLHKYVQVSLPTILNLSTNETLSRTILTSGTTALAVVALLIFGGNVLYGFSIAMLWGIGIGTYSSIYIAVPILTFLKIR